MKINRLPKADKIVSFKDLAIGETFQYTSESNGDIAIKTRSVDIFGNLGTVNFNAFNLTTNKPCAFSDYCSVIPLYMELYEVNLNKTEME